MKFHYGSTSTSAESSASWSKVELPSPGSTDQPIQTSTTSTSNNNNNNNNGEKSERVPLNNYQQQVPLEKNLHNNNNYKQQPKTLDDDNDSLLGTTTTMNNGDDDSSHRYRRFFFILLLGSCCCCIGWIFMNHRSNQHQHEQQQQQDHDTMFTFGTSTDSNQNDDDTIGVIEIPSSQLVVPNNEAVEPGGFIPLRRRVPFSTLDPVHDLHLYDYHRSIYNSPPFTLTKGKYGTMMNKKKNYNDGLDTDYGLPLSSNETNEISEEVVDDIVVETQSSTNHRQNYPTNSWYQNLLLLNDQDIVPGLQHRAYTIPYIVDVIGPIPGLRVHANHPGASSNVVQLNIVASYGITLGASSSSALVESTTTTTTSSTTPVMNYHYNVYEATPLSLTMEWNEFPMMSTISKGMPYATMVYDTIHHLVNKKDQQQQQLQPNELLPTVAAEIALASHPIIDNQVDNELICTSLSSSELQPTLVQREIQLFFAQSDFTWLIFVSEPVYVVCTSDETTGGIRIQVVDYQYETSIARPFVLRVALSKLCTSGRDPIYCHQEKMHPTALLLGQGSYDVQLRQHAHLFPGPHSTFDYEYTNTDTAVMTFDWDVRNTHDIALHPVLDLITPTDQDPTTDVNSTNTETNTTTSTSNQTDTVVWATALITYALPHHFDLILEVPPSDHNIYCVNTLVGPACLYEGSQWHLKQNIPPVSFHAPRSPAPWSIVNIGESLKQDMNYTLPTFFQKGIGDTYFSGKMLAKLSRIVLIADELKTLCQHNAVSPEYVDACNSITLPDDLRMERTLQHLQSSVEIWINGTGVVPFVYDSAWGGVVSCGCVFDSETGTCRNKFPDCTGFEDPGLNFGNAFYNDMHFHYGYHIYAAAVVAHFNPTWGRNNWEQVLLLIRCIANPSEEDSFFPTWRHKDWYQGHSWASGIAMVFPNGKNQESSSEAIAAYEAVALYGKVMASAWKGYSIDKSTVATEIEKAGQLLTATELLAAKTYWHVKPDSRIKIYPAVYTQHAIGILWQTMAQFQTWFGNRPFLACGIQLLPLTPIAEFRDSLTWSKQMYHDFADSCEIDESCETNGWSVLQMALLATVGHPQEAALRALSLPPQVFESAGGNGHSLTNTLWYLGTRRRVDSPLPITPQEIQHANETNTRPHTRSKNEVFDCYQPDHCSDYVLDTIAGLYTCRQRMNWLIQERSYTEKQACYQIAVKENSNECGRCDPEINMNETVIIPTKCTPCTTDECTVHFNKCPQYPQTFVCTDGSSVGGCAQQPWDVPSPQCSSCCELSSCSRVSPAETRAKREANCPKCSRDVCRGNINQCPKVGGSQYLCLAGKSTAGCSMLPWAVSDGGQCEKCCTLQPGCEL